ncbi:MAG TPA: four helix bundle protein, partial [Gemmatimonadales bacterium]|nr:four helix bundle protein [Gemmatimonadales bacterium]
MGKYTDLEAWKAAHQLVLAVYRATATWPADERYGLTSQVRRAAVSVPANIVEGSARHGPREFRRFVDIALASHAELVYLLHLAADLGYIRPDSLSALHQLTNRSGHLIW